MVACNSLPFSNFSEFLEFGSSFSIHQGFSCILLMYRVAFFCPFNEFELIIKKIYIMRDWIVLCQN
jgi:hypothetical protein